MKGWIKERNDDRMNKRKDERMNKRMKGWIKERKDVIKKERMK